MRPSAARLVCDLPIGVVERALVLRRFEQLLVLAKAAGFCWEAAKALLLLRAGKADLPSSELDQCFASFTRLQQRTARTALEFYRLRDRAAPA